MVELNKHLSQLRCISSLTPPMPKEKRGEATEPSVHITTADKEILGHSSYWI